MKFNQAVQLVLDSARKERDAHKDADLTDAVAKVEDFIADNMDFLAEVFEE